MRDSAVYAPAAAVAAQAEKHDAMTDYPSTPVINRLAKRIAFYYHNDSAHAVALAGTFTGWQASIPFSRNGNGMWKAEIPMLPPGTYLYKFVVDNRIWVDDPENLFREPDRFNGFNSRFSIDPDAHAVTCA